MDAESYLDNLATTLEAARNADPLKVLSPISVGERAILSLSTERDWSVEFKQGLVKWFSKGALSSYYKIDTPYGERKNSKKKERTTYYNAERDGLKVQLGHTTSKNYRPDFWERGAEALVKSAICKEGEFSYSNGSYLAEMLSLGVMFEDLGEKK
jgi:hypothetical protein